MDNWRRLHRIFNAYRIITYRGGCMRPVQKINIGKDLNKMDTR
jgi:hypothetical protein